jgi:hypothetical protein
MDEAKTASEAARALAASRWGSTKVDRLVHELHDRAHQLGAEQLSELQDLVHEARGKAGR